MALSALVPNRDRCHRGLSRAASLRSTRCGRWSGDDHHCDAWRHGYAHLVGSAALRHERDLAASPRHDRSVRPQAVLSMSADIASIVERARNDDLPVDQQHAAFAELVRRFEESAFGWSLQLLDDPEEAKDATQDAFITAWLKLRQLREPAAFGAWLKRLVATQCRRRRRKSRGDELRGVSDVAHDESDHRERQRLLASAMSRLTEAEHRVVVLFYFLGRKIGEIAGILGVPVVTLVKRLHSARITIRRNLPRGVREEFMQLRPSRQFLRQVTEGVFDEYVGQYRFQERPELIVRIEREGSLLVSYGGGQRSVLASIEDNALV